MKYILTFICLPVLATTTISHVEPTATQALVTVTTNQSGNCLYSAAQGTNIGGAPVNDVNTFLFASSNTDARPGAIPGSSIASVLTTHKFVLGTRGQAGVQTSSTDNRAYSRALQQNTQYIVGVTCGTDAQVTRIFYTNNPASGSLYREPRFFRSYPGDYAYPSIPWTSRGLCTIDPETGACVELAALPGDLIPNPVGNQAQTFVSPLIGGTGWSGSGQNWSYSGTSQGSLFLPITPLSITNGSSSLPIFSTSGPTWLQMVATLSGTSPAVLVCLSVNYGQSCVGGNVSQAITSTPTVYTIGTQVALLESWRNSPRPPIGQADIATQTGTVNKSGSTITWASGNYFLPARWTAGSVITLGSTKCTIASMQSDLTLTLSNSACVSDGSGISYSATNFGFLVKPSTASSVTVALTTPSWLIGSAGEAVMPSAGFLNDVCQVATTVGPTGNGNLCAPGVVYGPPQNFNTSPAIFWIPQSGAPVNLIGSAWGGTVPSGFGDGSCGVNNMVFDGLQPGRFYCSKYITGATGWGLFYVQYTGSYAASIPQSFNQIMSSSTSTTLTTDVNALVATFETSGQFAAFRSAYGGVPSWNLVSFENYGTNGALLLESRFYGGNADAIGWWAVYSLDSGTIVAAMCTYCGPSGSMNRWGGDHSGFGTRVGATLIDTINIPAFDYAVGTTGQLTSSFSACPTNTFGATGNNCSTLTLSTLTPSGSRGIAPGIGGSNNILLGDYLYTNDNPPECVRVITLSGLVASIWRSQFIPQESYCTSNTSHAANLTMVMFPSLQHELIWSWATDPTGAAVTADLDSSDCHYGYTLSTFILGCVNANVTNQPPTGKPIRLGAMPTNLTNPVFFANYDAMFGNAWVPYIPSQDNCMNSHPSMTQENAPPSEQFHFIDNRPFGGLGPQCSFAGTFLTPTLVGTYVYKVPAANLAALHYNYRVHSWLVSTGQKVAVDISGPSSVLHDTSADWYKFCEVVVAGECFAGSAVGDVFLNLPYVSNVGPYACVSGTSSSAVRNDIDIAEMYSPLQGIQEVSTGRGNDPNGRGVRLISTAFSRRCTQSLFWNSREVGLGGWIYTTVDYLDGVNSLPLIIQKSPAPVVPSTNLGEFLSFPVSFGGGTTGDTVKIQFGFAEMDQGSLAVGNVPPCNTRNEGCFTDSTNSQPYLWSSEVQHAQSCASGCVVNANIFPATGGRVIYFKRIRQNGANTVTGPLEISVLGQ